MKTLNVLNAARMVIALALLGITTGQTGGVLICGMSSHQGVAVQVGTSHSPDCCPNDGQDECPMSSVGKCCHATPAIEAVPAAAIPPIYAAKAQKSAGLRPTAVIPSDLLRPPRT